MILGEILSILPLLNQLNLYTGAIIDNLKIYLEALNG
jgi:hypothetical protein